MVYSKMEKRESFYDAKCGKTKVWDGVKCVNE